MKDFRETTEVVDLHLARATGSGGAAVVPGVETVPLGSPSLSRWQKGD